MSFQPLRSLMTVSGMTFLSRIFGFIRDTCIARYLGAGIGTDAFVVAFRLPNLLRKIFAEGAFSQSFVPLLSTAEVTLCPEETQRFINRTFTLIVIGAGCTSLLGCLLAQPIISLIAPGFRHKPSFALSIALLRITFPYILFISLVTLSASVLNVKKYFAWPAATPIVLNLTLIVAVVMATGSAEQKVFYLAWGVFCAGIIQCFIQIPILRRLNAMPQWDWSITDPLIRQLMRQMLPAILGVSVTQINLLLNTLFASLLPTGSISWIYYADRLMEFPTGLLGAALTTILLPEMSQAQAQKDEEKYVKTIDWGLKWTFLVAIPCSMAVIDIGQDIITCLFGYGHFDHHAVVETSHALSGYVVGLFPIIAIKVLASAFYARQDIKTPAKTAVAILAITQIGNLLLIPLLGQMGLTLSISFGALFNALFLFYKLRRQGIYRLQAGWLKFTIQIIASTAVLLIYLETCNPKHQTWISWHITTRLATMSALCLGGLIVYFSFLHLIGLRLRDVTHIGHKKDEQS